MNYRDNIGYALIFLTSLQACGSDTATTNAGDKGEPVNQAGSRSEPPPDQPPVKPAGPPAQVAHKAYVGLFGDSAVGVIDSDAKQVIKTIPVSAPDGLVVTPDGKKVYVSSMDSGTVKVIETEGDTLAGSIDVGSKPAGLALTANGEYLVVAAGGANEAVVVDTDTDTVVKHATVGQAHASCVTSDGHYAYVGSQVTDAPAIVRVDLEGDEAPQPYAVDKSPRMLACEADRIYFTAVGLDAVEVLNPDSGKLEAPIASGGSPHDVRASDPGKTELVVSQTAGDLEFIDVVTQQITAKVPTGKLAHWIAVSADHETAYVSNEGDDNVSVVDLASKTVTDTFSVGKAPRKLALRP